MTFFGLTKTYRAVYGLLFLLFPCIQVVCGGYCESTTSSNTTDAVLAVCRNGFMHDVLEAFLESNGTETKGTTCECNISLFDPSNMGVTFKSNRNVGDEFRINGYTFSSPMDSTYLDTFSVASIHFQKRTDNNTAMSCLYLVSGRRFNLTCMEPSPGHQTTTLVMTTESTVQSVQTTSTKAMQDETSTSSGTSQTPLSQASEDTPEDDGISIAIIAGAAGGGAFVLILIIVITVICLRKTKSPIRKTRQNQEESHGEADYYMSDNAQYISADTIKANTHKETHMSDTEGPEYAVPMKANKHNEHGTQATPEDTDYAHYDSSRDTYMDTNSMSVPANTVHNTEPKFDIEHDNVDYTMVNPSQSGREGSFGQKRTTDVDNYNHLNEVIQNPETGNVYNTISHVHN